MSSDATNSASEKPKRKVRDNIEAFAIAILMAILMKFFAIEAYQIPTSSMQPTMMGSSAAGVYDRIIVDKARYLFADPKRWDIVVFRYPIRSIQSYVKRLVGMPGDRLRIAGGNVYVVDDAEGELGNHMDPDDLLPLRRPDSVQEEHWKQVFPARYDLLALDDRIESAGGTKLARCFSASGGQWDVDGDAFTCKPRRADGRVSLQFTGNPEYGGLVNQVFDGYPTWIQAAMLKEPGGVDLEGVQDVRIGFDLTPRSTPSEFEIELAVVQQGGRRLVFALKAKDGSARLVVLDNSKQAKASEPFDLPMPAGSATRVQFAHFDDQCVVWLDGDRVQELDTQEFKSLAPMRPNSAREGRKPGVTLSMSVRGGGSLRVADLSIDRDLHYVPSTMAGNYRTDPYVVPGGAEGETPCYFMMGDNTLQSVDSRDWTQITVGVIDGRIVDPATHPEAERLTGNMRPVPITQEPDRDENPVIVASEDKIVFTDHLGEIHVLDGKTVQDPANGKVYGPGSMWFEGDDGPWEPIKANRHFVPCRDVLGRPLLNFWPIFNPFRLGLIR